MIDPFFDPPLSPQGEHRRRQILARSLAVARRRVWRRRTVPIVLFALILTCWAIPLAQRAQTPLAIQSNSSPAQSAHPSVPMSTPTVTIRYLQTDPNILNRLAAHPGQVECHWLSDDQFLTQLAQGGKPVGLAYVNGQAILITADSLAPKSQSTKD